MNVLLITIDCLRADHLSCLGCSKRITPNLDKLASTGMLFTQAISVSGFTPASFTAIFTSTYPLMYGGQLYVTNWRTTLAQVLKEHGYHTAAFHSNPWVSSFYGYQKGFGTFGDGIRKGKDEAPLNKPKEFIKRIVGTDGRLYELLAQLYGIITVSNPYGKAEMLNKKAISWLHGNPNKFFLWIHYMDVHEPYLPSSKLTSLLKGYGIQRLNKKAHHFPDSLSTQEARKLIDLYDAQISYVDQMIGSLLHTLKRSNIIDDTLVIVTADHGQQFMEHGHFGHGRFVYDEVIRIPLVIAGSGLQSQVIGQQVSLLDLAPTILDMLKIEKPKAFLGDSLLPLMGGNGTRAGSSEAISEIDTTEKNTMRIEPRLDADRRKISLRTGKWKYIYTEGEKDELYCLEDDPKETQNIIDTKPEIATELRTRIMAHIEFEEKTVPSEEELIKAKIRKLKTRGRI